MARNKKLRDYPETLFEEGSPVVVDKMQLCYNSDYGVNVLQITFRNASPLPLYGLSIMIATFDKDGNPTADGEVEYNYYGIEIPSGRTFGSSEDIVMEEEAVSFSIRVIRAEYPGDDMFRGDIRLRPMPEPEALETLGEFEEPFRAQVAEKKPNLKLHCVPEKKNFYWRCVCGRIYPKDIEHCRTCRLERDWITGIVPKLKQEKREQEAQEAERRRLEAEEQERLMREEEARLAEEARLQAEKEAAERLAEEEARKKAEEEEAARQEAERQAAEEAARKKKQMIRVLIIVVVIAAVAALASWRIYVAKQHKEPLNPPSVSAEEEQQPTQEPETEAPAEEPEVSYGQSIAIMGADLTEEDRKVVLRLIGIQESDFAQFTVVPVTIDQEHAYLDATIDPDLIGNASKSCLLITPTAPGNGLNISMYNINYCTEDMYRQALQSVGINDANVIIAAARSSAGTSALTGIYLAPQYLNAEQ